MITEDNTIVDVNDITFEISKKYPKVWEKIGKHFNGYDYFGSEHYEIACDECTIVIITDIRPYCLPIPFDALFGILDTFFRTKSIYVYDLFYREVNLRFHRFTESSYQKYQRIALFKACEILESIS